MYQQLAPGVAPLPGGFAFNNSSGPTTVPTQGLASQNNAFQPFPGWSAPPFQQYIATDPTAFGHQIPFANLANGVTGPAAALPSLEQMYERIEKHSKELEAGHSQAERWYALYGPSLTEPARNEFFGQRRLYNIGKANLRSLKERFEKLPEFHTLFEKGVSGGKDTIKSQRDGGGDRLPAHTDTASGALNIWGERVINRPSKVSSANTRFSDVGPIPFKLGAERDNVQSDTGNGNQDHGDHLQGNSVDSLASKHSGEASECGDVPTPTCATSFQSDEEKAKEWARRCNVHGIKIQPASESDSPSKEAQIPSKAEASSRFNEWARELTEGRVPYIRDKVSKPLADRSNNQDKAGNVQSTDSQEVVIIFESPKQIATDAPKNGRTRLTGHDTDGHPLSTGITVDPVSENNRTASKPRVASNTGDSGHNLGQYADRNKRLKELTSCAYPTQSDLSNHRSPAPPIPRHPFLDGADDEPRSVPKMTSLLKQNFKFGIRNKLT